MQENLGNERTLRVKAFDPIGREVLSLLKLEDVLFPVDDPKAVGLGVKCPHVSGLEPPVRSDGLPSHVGLLIVSQENLRAPQPNLPSRKRVSILVDVLRSVLHFRDVRKSKLNAGLYRLLSTVISVRTPGLVSYARVKIEAAPLSV